MADSEPGRSRSSGGHAAVLAGVPVQRRVAPMHRPFHAFPTSRGAAGPDGHGSRKTRA